MNGPKSAIVVLDFATRRILRSEGGESARRWLVTPGSTVKPLVLRALLDSGKLRPGDEFACPIELTLAGRSFSCSHPATGIPMTLPTAIAYSCNCYVAHFARRFGEGELARSLSASGFQTAPAPVELQALGEAGVLVSAVDLANAYHSLAMRAPQPIVEGLEGAVEYGTARLASLDRAKVAGKTGTGRTHAWFAGFAPSRSPKLVISVLAAGHSGGADAAPIAARILGEML